MKGYVFPGQGAQVSGMGKDIYDKSSEAKKWFHQVLHKQNLEKGKVMIQ